MAGALAPAPDPRITQLTSHQRQRALLSRVAQASRDVTARKVRLKAMVEGVRERLPAMLEQARREVRAGSETMARLTLQRRQAVLHELQTLERQLADVENEEANLTTIELRLSGQVEAFAARQEVIKARFSVAEAQVQINEAVTGVSEDFAELTAALRRAEERTESLEARASAIDRLVQDGDLSAEFFGHQSSRGLPPTPAFTDDEVDNQLSALRSEDAG